MVNCVTQKPSSTAVKIAPTAVKVAPVALKPSSTFVVGRTVADLKQVQIPGATKPFEEMTIAELVNMQVRNPGESEDDSYTVEGFTSDISVSGSSILRELGDAAALQAIKTAQLNMTLANLPAQSKTLVQAASQAAAAP